MIRTKGEAGTGDIVNAVRHATLGLRLDPPARIALDPDELFAEAKELQAPVELVKWVAEHGRLPVVTFTAGGIATPADAALCMQLGADGVFVGSGIFKSADPPAVAKAIVEATTHYNGRSSRRSHGASAMRCPASRRRRSGGRAARNPRLVAVPNKIGILAVKGDFREHAAMLRRLGAEPVEVRKPEQLEDLDRLVIPGGESTAIMRLIGIYGLEEALRRFAGPSSGRAPG